MRCADEGGFQESAWADDCQSSLTEVRRGSPDLHVTGCFPLPSRSRRGLFLVDSVVARSISVPVESFEWCLNERSRRRGSKEGAMFVEQRKWDLEGLLSLIGRQQPWSVHVGLRSNELGMRE